MTGRRLTVLQAAATALSDGRDPLERTFLIEHAVTLDECFDLADDLALGARMVMMASRAILHGGALARQVAAGRMVEAALMDLT